MDSNKHLSLHITSQKKSYNYMDNILYHMQLAYGSTNQVQSHSVSVQMILVSNTFTNQTISISAMLFNNTTNYLLTRRVNTIVGSIFNGIIKTIMLISPNQIIYHQSSKDSNILKLNEHTLLLNHFVNTIRLVLQHCNQTHLLLYLLLMKPKFNK